MLGRPDFLVLAAQQEQPAALAVEAKTNVPTALGDRGHTADQRHVGYWLQELESRPPPKK